MEQENKINVHENWPAFSIDLDDVSDSPTDLSYLLEKPAGKRGFIRIYDGHLATGEDHRWRIWGQNLCGRTALPPMEKAPLVARHLAKYGLNCIRLHFMDIRWPNGLLMRSKNPNKLRKSGDLPVRPMDEDTRRLDPEAMARLDYFIACCKEAGIYIDLNLNVARPFTAADGVQQAEWVGYAKALTYFDPRLIELQKEYAAQLLGHFNPFTGNRYADEPAVALVELFNENSLLESWLSDRLHGDQKEPAGTWCDIPPVYAEVLDQRWNNWLIHRYASQTVLHSAWEGDLEADEIVSRGRVRRLRRAEFTNANLQRFADETAFYQEIERGFFEDMHTYLKTEVGVKQIILGCSEHNQGLNSPLHLQNLARLGITDGHFYWQHPEFSGQAWSLTNWSITNTPMVDDLDRNVIARLSRSRVKGLPYLVSETNCPFPNEFSAGFVSILAAYGRFQDWDGVFPYNYNQADRDELESTSEIRSFFAIANDPVKMAETAVGALVFLRGDVKTALQTVERQLTREQMVESQRHPLSDAPYLDPKLPGRLALLHGVSIANFDAEEALPIGVEFPGVSGQLVSDTGELTWQVNTKDGKVLIDSPRWQAVMGRAGEYRTSRMIIQLQTRYAAIELISLDGRSIDSSKTLLLITAARVANQGMKWKDDQKQSLGEHFGSAPTLIEPILGSLQLLGRQAARDIRLTSLDGCGQRQGAVIQVDRRQQGWKVDFNRLGASVWHLIEVLE